MSENLMGASFGGAGSFMTHGYAIWRDGLGGDSPNRYAVQQGDTYAERMFYIRSMHELAAYRQFIDYLKLICEKEAEKERRMVKTKLEKMRPYIPTQNTLTVIERAIEDNNFGLAYTFLTNLNESVEDWLKEMNRPHFQNISHKNSFWNVEFSTYISRLMKDKFEVIDNKMITTGQSHLTIDEIVEGYIQEIMMGSSGLYIESLDEIKKTMKTELLNTFRAAGLDVLGFNEDVLGKGRDITQLRNRKTTLTSKKRQQKSIETLCRELGDEIGKAVGRGMGQEIRIASKAGKNSIAFDTGNILKEVAQVSTGNLKKVQQKTDVIFFETSATTLDLTKFINELYENGIKDTATAVEKTREWLLKLSQENGEEIFEVNVNVKGYKSRRDLQIEGRGSFAQRTQNLVRIAQEAQGLPALSMDKLIFMLNNTMDGCIQENRKEYIIDYFAAICVAWMWDDYTDLLSISEKSSGITKIHLFSSGGVYYSASQIIRQTLDNLIKQASKTGATQMVNVQIIPPTFDADAEYDKLRNSIFPLDESTASDEARQEQLKKRWDAMRDKVSQQGQIAISIKQSPLEELVNKIYQYL